mgnify:FL=1
MGGVQKYLGVVNDIPNLQHASSRFIEVDLSINFTGDRDAAYDFGIKDGTVSASLPKSGFSAPQSLDGNGDPQGTFGLRVNTATSGQHGPIVIFKDTELTNTNS